MANLVSVILPAYRAEKFIARAVASVLAQSMPDWELVIASDDGSDYPALLRKQGFSDPRLRGTTTGGRGRGAAAARNAALDAARGDIIAVLDADDAFLPRHLERMAPLAAHHALAITRVAFLDHETDLPIADKSKPFNAGLLRLDEVLLACFHGYSSVVFDRRRICCRWNERIPLMEDVVFLAEAFGPRPSVWFECEPSYRYFRRPDSLCNTADAAQRFIEAGHMIRNLLARGQIAVDETRRKILQAYLARNDEMENAFGQALANGTAKDYQEFIGRHLGALHAPLA